MRRLAAATISALGAVHAGFNRNEEAIVDRFFDLPREEDETLEVVVRPERVELMVSRRFCLGEDVEPQRQSSYLAKTDQKANVKGKTFFTSRIKKKK